ncbi:Rad52/22 family double-strand break repair protein [Paenibacillus sp. 1_12]|uniref:Rad52/Rad22 family DNA repair protein n=1 Tax=Paenibacillus sp. 1_12 TaxID=1566278 RepID=UPI0008E1FD22|nr:Rad52/Rad22 family DNA repair protein [Paenibacillus sp. 1_12]SFK76037.1 Rad52/22 family double-strand break repair protein [Paenibacillus sp. 1_12]
MENESISLFERLNAPFPYSDYQYDSFGDRCYISGQTITERLNEVLGVGYWKYEGLYETEKIIQEPNGKNPRVKMYVRFSIFNSELRDWITFIDVGSEQVKPGMNEGDATKSAITDGMKKCASRIGVGSDLYKGKITWDKQRQAIIVPDHYNQYYHDRGWIPKVEASPPSPVASNRTSKKSELTDKLKNKASAVQNQIKAAWQELAGSLDGLDEWYTKKQQEHVTDQQMINLLQKKLQEKRNAASA